MHSTLPPPTPRAFLGPYWVVGAVILACVLPELILQAADFGLLGSARWRPLAYQYGAFWAGLLYHWRPNFAAQPLTMFFTYAFLHAGFLHLLGNMMGLVLLGQVAVQRVGTRGFIALYTTSAMGGAAVFALLSQSAAPMVGASGALFGLAAAWIVWDWQNNSNPRRRLRWSMAVTLGLALLNVLIWISNAGQLAWETHLGGFAAGGLVALLWPTKRSQNTRS